MIMTPNSTSRPADLSSSASEMVFFEGGTGFLFRRILTLSMPTTEGPPRCDRTCSFNDWIVVVAGFNDGRLSVIFGFRADFSVMDTVGAAASEPGAGAAAGVVFGGDG